MPNNSQKALLQAATGQIPHRLPIWFLRQAGRYLPEYQAIRKSRSFLEVCKNPELACEITLQPLRRFDLDAAIIFSDILIVAEALGQKLTFDAGHGPVLRPCVREYLDVSKLNADGIEERCSFVGESLRLVKNKLAPHISLIGFAGAPFTVATYMIEGAGSKQFFETKKMIYKNPQAFFQLIEKLTEATYHYLCMQIKAGADVLMLFDTWASALSYEDYKFFVLPHLKRLCARLSEHNTPIIYFSGQGGDRLGLLTDLPVQVLALDWRVHTKDAIEKLKNSSTINALQGNIDPLLLCFGSKELIQERAREICHSFSAPSSFSHIFNVGHGLTPETDIQRLEWLIESLRTN